MIPVGILGAAHPMAGGGGDLGAPPEFLGFTASAFPSATADHLCQMPETQPGDLLLAVVSTDATGATSQVSPPPGWSMLFTLDDARNSMRGTVLVRTADGSESGGVVNFQTGGNTELAAAVGRVRTGTFSGTPEISAASHEATTSAPTPALSPSWGAKPTLWIPVMFLGRAPPYSGPYTDNFGVVDAMASSTNGCSLGVCTHIENVSTLSPGTWSHQPSSSPITALIAVRPSAV